MTNVGAEVLLPSGDQMKTDKAKFRKRNSDGSFVGTSHDNPLLFDTRSYVIEFQMVLKRNTLLILLQKICMHAQCNPDEEQFLSLEGICDHRKDDQTVDKADEFIFIKGRNPSGNQLKVCTFLLKGEMAPLLVSGLLT